MLEKMASPKAAAQQPPKVMVKGIMKQPSSKHSNQTAGTNKLSAGDQTGVKIGATGGRKITKPNKTVSFIRVNHAIKVPKPVLGSTTTDEV